MTVYENMAFGLKLRKFPKAEIDARVREAAAMLGLTDYLDRQTCAQESCRIATAETLSGGLNVKS